MYVLKNPLANEGLESPINRPAYRALDPELQTLYRADNGVDEGDDEPTTLPYTEVRDHDDDETFEDDPTDLGIVAMADTADNSYNSPSEPDINNSDSFGGFGDGSFGGAGASGDWEPDGGPTDSTEDTSGSDDDNSDSGSDDDSGGGSDDSSDGNDDN